MSPQYGIRRSALCRVPERPHGEGLPAPLPVEHLNHQYYQEGGLHLLSTEWTLDGRRRLDQEATGHLLLHRHLPLPPSFSRLIDMPRYDPYSDKTILPPIRPLLLCHQLFRTYQDVMKLRL